MIDTDATTARTARRERASYISGNELRNKSERMGTAAGTRARELRASESFNAASAARIGDRAGGSA